MNDCSRNQSPDEEFVEDAVVEEAVAGNDK